MRIEQLVISGAYRVLADRHADDRGYFERLYCQREWASLALPQPVQSSVSHSVRRGTLRGLHYQSPPHDEDKVVTCLHGAIYDVIVDMRSQPYQCHALVLDAIEPASLFLPKGVAHGFQTLEDNTLVLYQMSAFYAPDAAQGLRYDDPKLGIEWPIGEPIVSLRDRAFALLA